MPAKSRAFSLPALLCRSALEPSVTTAQVPPDFDQPSALPSSKLSLSRAAANAIWLKIAATIVNAATAPVMIGHRRRLSRGAV